MTSNTPQIETDVPHPTDVPLEGKVRFENLPGSTLSGLAAWFTLNLAPGVDMQCGPADAEQHWGQAYIPISPIEVPEGATLEVDARIVPADDDRRAMIVEGAWRMGEASGRLHHRQR